MPTSDAVQVKAPAKISPARLDLLAEEREKLRARLDEINQLLAFQVDLYGFTPARADKSKRLLGDRYQATVSYGESTEIRDAQVEAIENQCPQPLFARLFRKVTQYKLTSGASMLLAGTLPEGAPSNLRKLFAAAVVIKPKSPALRIELVREGNGSQ